MKEVNPIFGRYSSESLPGVAATVATRRSDDIDLLFDDFVHVDPNVDIIYDFYDDKGDLKLLLGFRRLFKQVVRVGEFGVKDY